MRKFIVIILLILLLTLTVSFAAEVYNDLSNELNTMAFVEDAHVSEKDNHLYIQMNVTFQDKKMIYYYQDIIEKVYLESPAKSITLLVYSNGFPLFRIQSTQGDIEEYINETINRNEFIEKMGIEDIRSIEKVLYDDLNLFDAYITGIYVDETESIIQLESMQSPDSFQDDLMAMALTVIENTPWVDTVVFEFFKDEEQIMTIKGDKDSYLMAIKGSISEKEFVESLSVEISDNIIEEASDTETMNDSETVASADKDYTIINVASGKINEVISVSKTFKLEVPESNEYYFKINNFETLKAELIIRDEKMQIIKDNIRDKEVIDYIYADLESEEVYYLEVKPLNDSTEEVDISIETSSSILPFLVGALIILGGIIFLITKLLKKVTKK